MPNTGAFPAYSCAMQYRNRSPRRYSSRPTSAAEALILSSRQKRSTSLGEVDSGDFGLDGREGAPSDWLGYLLAGARAWDKVITLLCRRCKLLTINSLQRQRRDHFIVITLGWRFVAGKSNRRPMAAIASMVRWTALAELAKSAST